MRNRNEFLGKFAVVSVVVVVIIAGIFWNVRGAMSDTCRKCDSSYTVSYYITDGKERAIARCDENGHLCFDMPKSTYLLVR